MHKTNWLSKVDYTLLEECNENDIQQLCENAIKLNVKSVCVYPQWVHVCSELLKGTSVLVCTVIDFPLGQNSLQNKIHESREAILHGADELDLVMNFEEIKNHKIYLDILKSWAEFSHQFKNKVNERVTLKVIVESGLLTLEETKLVTELCISSKVDFIKTSTGKVGVGAEIGKVQAMRETIIDKKSLLKIKASGGIRTIDQITQYDEYVDRFGMGYKSVDTLVENT